MTGRGAAVVIVLLSCASASTDEPDPFEKAADARERAADAFEKRLESVRDGLVRDAPPVERGYGDEVDVEPGRPGYRPLHLLKADGTPVRPFVTDVAFRRDYVRQGSPAWSADGSTVAFDCYRLDGHRKRGETQVVVCRADGSDARVVVGNACVAGLSPDGSRLVVSRYGRVGYGVWVANADGSGLTEIDDEAWGGQFSPDGNSILFYGGRVGSWNTFSVHDLGTGRTRELVSRRGWPFRSVGWNFDWAPDGERFAFWGLGRDGTTASSVMGVDGGVGSLVTVRDSSGDRPYWRHLAWHPDGTRLLVTLEEAEWGRRTTHVVEARAGGRAESLPGLPEALVATSAIYSPDGTRILAAVAGR